MAAETLRMPVQTIGDYELLEKIAEGGMGTVYKARQLSTGNVVALKIVPPHLTSNAVLMKRFEQEYTVASNLDHPNIVRALDFGAANGSPYLAMEYVEGESLGGRLEREGRLAESEAIRIAYLVAQGLHKAHKRGLIHRDVKPDNILLTPDGQVKLADLGLVKELETDLNLTKTGRGLGTPHFMAPEQFRDAKNADARCDIYSLAATLYMMVTGELPFKSLGPVDAWMKKIDNKLPPARQLVPSLSERVDWAIQRGMSADPNQRPHSCREFVEDLTGHSTRKLTPATEMPDVWFILYTDRDGVLHTIRGSQPSLRRSIKEGSLGNPEEIRAARNKGGPFEYLRNHPEFRDLVVGPAPAPRAPARSRAPLTPIAPPTAAPVPRTPPVAAVAESSSVVLQPALDRAPNPSVHINLGAGEGPSEWLKWLLFLALAAAAAVIGFYLLPLLR